MSYETDEFLGGQVTSSSPLWVRFSSLSTQLDAFGRMRVSQPEVLGYGSFEHGLDTLRLEKVVNGSATASALPNESSIDLL